MVYHHWCKTQNDVCCCSSTILTIYRNKFRLSMACRVHKSSIPLQEHHIESTDLNILVNHLASLQVTKITYSRHEKGLHFLNIQHLGNSYDSPSETCSNGDSDMKRRGTFGVRELNAKTLFPTGGLCCEYKSTRHTSSNRGRRSTAPMIMINTSGETRRRMYDSRVCDRSVF